MKRAVKTIHPFEFNADFSVSAPREDVAPETGTITVSTDELVQYLLQMRAEGAAEARAGFQTEQAERLEAVSAELTRTLADLVALAGHLEASAYSEEFKQTSLNTITACAKRIIDGQRDLFIDREENVVKLPSEHS